MLKRTMIKLYQHVIFIGVIIVASFVMFTGSCAKRGATVKKDETVKTEKAAEKASNKELIKPSVDDQKLKAGEPEIQTGKELEEAASKKSKPASGANSSRKSQDQKQKNTDDTEDARITGVMRELAKSVGGVTLAKLCYVKDDDEWWIMLYRESSGKVDLKQFIWNRHSEKAEPFLVIREFSRGRMSQEMKKNEEGKECKVIKLEEEKQK